MHVLAVLGAEARHHEGARADAHLLHRQVHLVRVRGRSRIKVRVRARARARASKPR